MQNSREADAFDQLVRPLEIASGSRLNEPARTTCRVAYAAHPEGCRLVARNALKRGGSNPVGLFCRMIRDGDHQHLDELVAADRVHGGSSRDATPVSTWRLEVIRDVSGSDVVSYETFESEQQCEARRLELSTLAGVVEMRVSVPRGAVRDMGRGRTAREIYAMANGSRRLSTREILDIADELGRRGL